MIMLNFYARLMLISLLIFTATLLLVHTQPYDDYELRQLLPENCPAPCFMGIRPGVTTLEEARNILKASGWADHIVLNSGLNLTASETFISLNWEWNDNRSPLLDATSPAFMLGFKQDMHAVVDEIYVSTLMPVGLMSLLLESPQRYTFGTLFPKASLTAKILSRISILYDKVEASVNLVCPLKFSRLWTLRSSLYFYSEAPVNEDIHTWDNPAIIRTLKSVCRP